jgi:hypothetical protein
MSWNYRLIEFADPDSGEPWQAIHEVYYDERGNPTSYQESPAAVMGDNQQEVRDVLCKMTEALLRPALVERDFQRVTEPQDASR